MAEEAGIPGTSRRETALKLLKRFAPEIAVGIVTGVISNVATGLLTGGKRKKGKKSKKK